MRLRIKFCGGCNSSYDRVELVNRLLALLKEKIPDLEISFREGPADQGVMVCGCSTCCIDRDDTKTGTPDWHVIGPDLLDYIGVPRSEIPYRFIKQLEKGRGL